MGDKLLNPKKLNRKQIALSRLKRKVLKHIWLARLGLISGIIASLCLVFLMINFVFSRLGLVNYLQIIRNFIFTPQNQIESFSGKTNVLILGKSGLGYESPDLTDTVIFASISHQDSSAVLVSLPRDLWIPALRAKLNSAYYWGNQKEEKGGLILAKSIVEEIVGQPIQYAIVIDFSGFKNVIDAIGGIEVYVDNGFLDQRYPIAGKENDACGGDKEFKCRYETVKFETGLQFMNGNTALKFVRSRNAEGEEGTDLARAARQEKIITAIKEKVLSKEVLLSPSNIKALVKAVQDSTETDINTTAASVLARRILQAKDSIESYVMPEDFLENPLISPKYDSLYVFIPKSGNWIEFQAWIKQKLN